MSIATSFDSLPVNAGPHSFAAHEDWLQGRNMYGGASACLAYRAVIRTLPDLPPLRAAQIGFVGPVSDQIELRVETLRRGRNVAQIRSEIWCEEKCMLTSMFLFGEGRQANAHYPANGMEHLPPAPEAAEEMKTTKAPAFIRHNFEILRAQDESGPGAPIVRRWARLKGEHGLDPISQLILVGDVLPPGSMRQMQRQGPVSSMNWSLNILDQSPQTDEGWWLAETSGEWADEGYTSEKLTMWNTSGQQVLSSMQSVAIFG